MRNVKQNIYKAESRQCEGYGQYVQHAQDVKGKGGEGVQRWKDMNLAEKDRLLYFYIYIITLS